jgi:hypothetical protein
MVTIPDPKRPRGCENYLANPPHIVFRRRIILGIITPPLDLATPPVATVLLVVGVVLPTLG